MVRRLLAHCCFVCNLSRFVPLTFADCRKLLRRRAFLEMFASTATRGPKFGDPSARNTPSQILCNFEGYGS